MNAVVLVGVDGSEYAARAVQWCADHAGALGVEVVAVHVVQMPLDFGTPYRWVPMPTVEDPGDFRERAVAEVTEWCAPLADAGVPFRVVVKQGYAAVEIMETARAEAAELVVTGRRGLGGFKELVMGSTSHYLSHHLDRPLLIVP